MGLCWGWADAGGGAGAPRLPGSRAPALRFLAAPGMGRSGPLVWVWGSGGERTPGRGPWSVLLPGSPRLPPAPREENGVGAGVMSQRPLGGARAAPGPALVWPVMWVLDSTQESVHDVGPVVLIRGLLKLGRWRKGGLRGEPRQGARLPGKDRREGAPLAACPTAGKVARGKGGGRGRAARLTAQSAKRDR